MSNIGLIIAERSRDIGDFLVGRLIPFRKKRMIGPFIFIDHMGPVQLGPKKYMGRGPAPAYWTGYPDLYARRGKLCTRTVWARNNG